MKKALWISAITFALATTEACAQMSCPRFLLESPMVVNIEGHFINAKKSRASLDVEWRHHPQGLDTFFVHLENQAPFSFITAGKYRYLEYPEISAKRQLGTHHLKETIGETPLKLDDMELLANGQFLCKDNGVQNSNSLSTAFSMAWWSLTADTLTQPKTVTMRGARKETRTFNIRQWKNFSGAVLPTLVHLESEKYDGEIWIRSAYPIQALAADPLKKSVQERPQTEQPDLFLKIPVKGERKIPLILKLNQELLRE